MLVEKMASEQKPYLICESFAKYFGFKFYHIQFEKWFYINSWLLFYIKLNTRQVIFYVNHMKDNIDNPFCRLILSQNLSPTTRHTPNYLPETLIYTQYYIFDNILKQNMKQIYYKLLLIGG